jgi:hypothetical protein
MNKFIYKYVLPIQGSKIIFLPEGAEILTVQADQKIGEPCLWALIDLDKKEEQRYLEVFGTGNPVGYDMGVVRKYIGTFQLGEGSFIGHVFERIN